MMVFETESERSAPTTSCGRVVELKSQIKVHLPTAYPGQQILRVVFDRIPRLAT
jgi:hypothetical protein